MSKNFLQGLQIGELLTKIPIVQGGMGVGVYMSLKHLPYYLRVLFSI